MQTLPVACFLSLIRPPGIQFENALLQIAPVHKGACPFVRDHNDVDFQLFTRHNPTVPQPLAIDDDEALFASNIDLNDETVLYFHAFMETGQDGSSLMVREAYMQRGDTNFIMVDAQYLEAGPWYFKAAENTWYIGRTAALFIDYLVSRGLNLSKTHLVGHSLGAQSAGVAGAALRSGRVSRITGLDAAFPLFDKVPLEQRLDPTDAEFVDVIHTDAGIFGFQKPIGHVDFYPNSGKSPQPGCELEVVIPQQLLFNKCEGNSTSIQGFYTYYLKENKQTHKLTNILRARTANGIFTAFKNNKMHKKSTKSFWKKIHEIGKIPKSDQTSAKFHQIGPKEKTAKSTKTHTLHRERRFASFLKKQGTSNNNGLFRILEFLAVNGRKVVPVISIVREISTLVKTTNGELNHLVKEKNNYIGQAPSFQPSTYTLELDNNSKIKSFLKNLFGLGQGDKLTVSNNKK